MTLLQTAHAALATWKIPCTMSYNAQAWLTFRTSLGLWISCMCAQGCLAGT
jgi:hypothetical protein